MPRPICLTVAGSDPSGGAGIQADLKTFSAMGVYGMAVITALTAQNTQEVRGIHPVPAEFVGLQIDTVLDDIPCRSVKTGMLADADIIRIVTQAALTRKIRLVVDPVMVSTSGARLLDESAVQVLIRELIPLSRIVTPNAPEAGVLTGSDIRTWDDMQRAARRIHEMGADAVLIKGGDMRSGDVVTDVFFDGINLETFRAPRIETRNTHGSGCTLASAICAGLALGRDIRTAVLDAREFVYGAIKHAEPLGEGNGPLDHMWQGGRRGIS
jgi:hydroxymethylpyrimidine/phosphomethylpyrimidine kinase